jgi:hypothetical protein
MAKRRRTIGGGITARNVLSFDGADMQPAFAAFARRWNAALAESGGSQFGAVMLDQEQACRCILDGAGIPPFKADSIEWWAWRILRAIEATHGHIARGDADSAARAAVEVGALVTEVSIKHFWEAHALRGEKNAKTLNAAAARRNAKRRNVTAQRHKLWQAMADCAWGQNRHLTARDVAKHIAAETGDNADTVRRKIIHNR